MLGSGLGGAMANVHEETSFSFDELPGFPRPTVAGHAGALVLGELSSVPVAVFRGRIHFYEGNDLSVCALPIRLARSLGAGTAILTAATGGIGEGLETGDLVVGADHMNFLGQSPLRGWRRPDGSPPFVDMVNAYDPVLADLAVAAAERRGLAVSRRVRGDAGSDVRDAGRDRVPARRGRLGRRDVGRPRGRAGASPRHAGPRAVLRDEPGGRPGRARRRRAPRMRWPASWAP